MNLSLRLLSIAVGTPNPYTAQWIRILSIAKGLKDRRNDVKLVIFRRQCSFGNFSYSLNGLNCRVIPYVGADLFHKNLKLLREYKPELIFANTHIPAFISALNKFRRAPLVFDMHGFAVEERKLLAEEKDFFWACRQILPNLLIEHFAIQSSDKILCVSHHMMRYLNQMKKVQLNKMEYVTNGVNLNFFKPLKDNKVLEIKRKLGLENKLVFGYIGGLQRWQGVEKFVEAAHLINDDKMGFLIVGGNNTWLNKNVVKLKKVSRKQLPYYYLACDVLVLPRLHHIATEVAAPTKFAEYTAMGKPVLVTNVGDAATFVKKYKCGIVISSNAPRNLKEGFYAFKELSIRELRRMGENSRRLAEEEFDWNKIIDRLNNKLTELVN